MSDYVEKYKDNLDMNIVVSTITSAIIIGLAVYGMRKVGLKTAANIVSAGA